MTERNVFRHLTVYLWMKTPLFLLLMPACLQVFMLIHDDVNYRISNFLPLQDELWIFWIKTLVKQPNWISWMVLVCLTLSGTLKIKWEPSMFLLRVWVFVCLSVCVCLPPRILCGPASYRNWACASGAQRQTQGAALWAWWCHQRLCGLLTCFCAALEACGSALNKMEHEELQEDGALLPEAGSALVLKTGWGPVCPCEKIIWRK